MPRRGQGGEDRSRPFSLESRRICTRTRSDSLPSIPRFRRVELELLCCPQTTQSDRPLLYRLCYRKPPPAYYYNYKSMLGRLIGLQFFLKVMAITAGVGGLLAWPVPASSRHQ